MNQDKLGASDTSRTVVITGGSSGLGYQTAAAILRSTTDWHVLIASRDKGRTTNAAETLAEQTRNPAVSPMLLDLGSIDVIRGFVEKLGHQVTSDALPPLHAVVCNAGLNYVSGTAYTDDGFEATLGVNYLGHFLLANLLIKHITAPARFVFLAGAGTTSADGRVNSDQGPMDRLTGVVPPRTDFENLESMVYPDEETTTDHKRVGMERYATSKLANVIMAFEFDRRLRANGLSSPSAPVTSNAFNPGLLPGTGLARDRGVIQRFLWSKVMPILSLLPSRASTDQRGHELAHIVTDPTLEAVSGVYFEGREVANPNPASLDEELARTLWDESVDLVGLDVQELQVPRTNTE